MNTVTIYGKVVGEPVYEGGSKVRTRDFRVAVERPSRRPGGAGADFIPVRLWNTLADAFEVKVGDIVLVQGRLRVERDGSSVVSGHDAWIVVRATSKKKGA